MLDVEERSIVELNLDFPSVFSKVRAGEGSRRFGRSKSILETNQGTDLTDGGQYLHFFSIVKTKPSFFCLKGSDRQSEVVELSMQYCAQIL